MSMKHPSPSVAGEPLTAWPFESSDGPANKGSGQTKRSDYFAQKSCKRRRWPLTRGTLHKDYEGLVG